MVRVSNLAESTEKFPIGSRVRAFTGSRIAGTVIGFDEVGWPVIHWDNGVEQSYRAANLVRVEA